MASARLTAWLSETAIATAIGRRGLARLSCASRSCARAATSRAFSSRAGWPRRPSRRSCRRPTFMASRPARSTTSCAPWAWTASPGARSAGCARRSTRRSNPSSAALGRPIEGDWPYVRLDATYLKVRRGGRIVSTAVAIAIVVNGDGRREVLGLDICPSEAVTFWSEFMRELARRGLRGVKLVISDAHEGLKGAVAKVLGASWQRCRVHFMRNALAHANKNGRRVVSAFIATAFAQGSSDAAGKQWRQVADQLRAKLPKLAALLDEAEVDVLAFMNFPKEHWDKISSTNPIERPNGEIKRRTNVVGIFPNDDAIVRLVGSILMEQNDEWAVQRARYMTLETIAPVSDNPIVILPAVAG